jgi:hypothetical protein
VTDDDWRAMRARYERFLATELGQLFRAYDRATINYWRHDADDTISNSKLKALDEDCREKTNAFVAKLMELAEV